MTVVDVVLSTCLAAAATTLSATSGVYCKWAKLEACGILWNKKDFGLGSRALGLCTGWWVFSNSWIYVWVRPVELRVLAPRFPAPVQWALQAKVYTDPDGKA